MKTTNKLLVAISSFAISSVALVGSTFAWFTLGTTGQVSDISGTMQASEGLKMGYGTDNNTDTDTIVWDSSFTMSEISAIGTTYIDSVIDPLTHTINSTELRTNGAKGTGLAEPDAFRGSVVAKADDSGYIQFDLYFYSDINRYVGIDPANTSLTFTPSASSLYTSGDLATAAHAMRIAFAGWTNYHSVSATADLYTVLQPAATATIADVDQIKLGAPQDLDADGFYDYDSASMEYAYGQWTTIDHAETVSATGTATPKPVSYNTIDSNHAITSYENSGTAVSEKAYYEGDLTASAVTATTAPLLYLTAGQTAQMTVIVYAEGFDSDCADYISSAAISLSLGFIGGDAI